MNDWRARRQQPTGPISGENVRNSKDETENLKWLRESSLAAVEAIRSYQNRGTSSRGAHVSRCMHAHGSIAYLSLTELTELFVHCCFCVIVSGLEFTNTAGAGGSCWGECKVEYEHARWKTADQNYHPG